jgi:hypothetical protein
VLLQGAVVTLCPLGLDEEAHVTINLTHAPRRIALQYRYVGEPESESGGGMNPVEENGLRSNANVHQSGEKLVLDASRKGVDAEQVSCSGSGSVDDEELLSKVLSMATTISLTNSALPRAFFPVGFEKRVFPCLKRLELLNTPMTLADLIELTDNCTFLKSISLLHTSTTTSNSSRENSSLSESWRTRAEFLTEVCRSEHFCFLSHPHLREIRFSEQFSLQFSGNKSRRFEICFRSILQGYIYELMETKIDRAVSHDSTAKCGLIQSFRIANTMERCQSLCCGSLSLPFHNDPSGSEVLCDGNTIGVSRSPITFALPIPVVDPNSEQMRRRETSKMRDSLSSSSMNSENDNSAHSTTFASVEQPKHEVVPVELGNSIKFSNPNFYSILGIGLCRRIDSVMLDFAQHKRLWLFGKRFVFEQEDGCDEFRHGTELNGKAPTQRNEKREKNAACENGNGASGSIVRVPRHCNLTMFLPLLVFVFYDRIDQQRY